MNKMPCHITDYHGPNPWEGDDTRPDDCECRRDDERGESHPAREHDDTNERCPLYECECGHQKQDHGPQGCEVELGDRYSSCHECYEAAGMCDCTLTPKQIELRARGLAA